ncbi:GTP cyclohydrolase 1 type 2/Nif3 [Protomyces lactucae-debilis]|uniref:GTP cyclohydrolase 1 type 2/Nif3 n=1 Tax=Protomyces lactucae-debilis TaxID=2754530 RepID=A0A1Y2F1V4_PROLT|nr:GTP cyclohydrolase 1 type 2/Nif3 [Protomyces lactucae-debilis]ORY77823.1 GTP cyclohydrolase 1 type 2/Nif3 [Protomyces lactucae-debilis]
MKSLRQVSDIVQKLFPPSLAGSWDNVGLLWEPGHSRGVDQVLLCIDLTTSVVNEVCANKSIGHVVAYHPPIFRGLKRFNNDDAQQKLLMRLASLGVGVVCVHTSADAIPGGVNDWLAHVIAQKIDAFRAGEPSHLHTKCLEEADTTKLDSSFDGAGAGRLLTLQENGANTRLPLSEICKRLKTGLGLSHLQMSSDESMKDCRTVAICAGSGGSLFESSKAFDKADLLVTGELSHHECLRYQEKKVPVILTGHSNSERGYLPFMKVMLEKAGLVVQVSEADKDPLKIV